MKINEIEKKVEDNLLILKSIYYFSLRWTV